MIYSVENHIAERPALPLWQRMTLLGFGYFLCAWLGRFLSGNGGTMVSFWLPAGLYVAVLLLNRTRDWPWLALAVLPANFAFDLLHGTKPVVILCFYCANTIQAVTGAWLVRRFVAECPTLATLKEFTGLAVLAGFFSTMPGALIGAATLKGFGLSESFASSWRIWWGGNVMAILLLTPFILTWFPAVKKAGHKPVSAGRKAEAVLLFLGLGVFVWYLLVCSKGILSPNKSLMVPLLLWAGLRFGARGATAASLLLALTLAFFTAQFSLGLTAAQVASGEYLFPMQTVLAMGSLVSLIPAIVLGERDRTLGKLRESEERFRNLSQAAFDGIAVTENGRFVDANEHLLKMLGYERNELMDKEVLAVVAPESRTLVADAIRMGLESTYAHKSMRKDGSQFHVEARARMVRLGNRTLRMTALRDITERKAAEQALRESEEKFSKAFRASPDGLAVSDLESGRFIEVNEGCCQIYDCPRDEMLGRTSVELGFWQNPQDRHRLVEEFRAAGRLHNSEMRVRTRAGGRKVVLLSSEPIELGGQACLVSALHDVTDRIRVEQALRASEESLRATIDNTPNVAVQWYDAAARVVFWSRASEKIFGWSAAAAQGKTLDQLMLSRERADAFEQALGRIALTGEPAGPMEFPFRHRNGAAGITLSTIFRIPVHPGGYRFVCMDVDITEQKNAEAEREQAVAREQQARMEYTRQLIAAQESERKRIAAELHDSMGQNLLLIKNLAQMALQARPGAPLPEQLASINHLAAQCIAEARQISRDLHPHQLDHLGLKRALEAMLEHAARASPIQFTSRFELVDDLFDADASMNLYRIVQESLNNILKHSRARHADIRLERDLHEVQLRIEDDGVGFEPGQPDSRRGLGLKNMNERVRMLGGKLNVEAAPGKGTRIEVTIPTAETPD